MNIQNKATVFEFVEYHFDTTSLTATFEYAIHMTAGDRVRFTEKITLPFDIERNISDTLMQNILRDLHLVLGVSYYKLFCPPEFLIHSKFTLAQANFWNTIYSDGLGEFLHRNNLSKKSMARFSSSDIVLPEQPALKKTGKLLVGIGGGKDSIVTVELLKKDKRDITGFLVETNKKNEIARKVMSVADIPQMIVTRELDNKLVTGVPDSYGGHVPISAMYAFIGNLVNVLYGFDYYVVSNEYSSNFGNLADESNDVNHQWSKSSAFESAFQDYTSNFVNRSIGYFSLLRPFYEIRIVNMFAELGERYFNIFSSCNVNFKIGSQNKNHWCGKCPKCAFAFTMLSAFISREEIEKIFGRNLFEDETLVPIFNDLLGFGETKPFDCVGIFDEVQAALHLAHNEHGDTLVLKNFLPKISDKVGLVKKVMSTNQVNTIPADFVFYGMKSVCILGYGKEGKVTERYLRKKYPDMTVAVADASSDKNYLDRQYHHDLIIKTPGIPKEWVKMQYTTATNIFFSELSKLDNVIIGITGSKGKSTVSTLIYKFLEGTDIPVRLLGNIGNPMLASLEDPLIEGEVVVCELSSFQLDDLELSPNIAVITNLFPDHLDYHNDLDAYYGAKKNITRSQGADDIFIYNGEYPLLQEWALGTRAQAINYREIVYDVHTTLVGKHNKTNILAAISVVRELGVDDHVIDSVLKTFTGLPHRLELVAEYNDIRFYDDAIATTPESAIAAIEALPDTETIFLGGTDRKYDFSELEDKIRVSNIKNVVLFPDTGKSIFVDEEELNILRTSSMEEAIIFAYENTGRGGICLLSPASPSYSLYKNFEERGDLFKNLIGEYYANK